MCSNHRPWVPGQQAHLLPPRAGSGCGRASVNDSENSEVVSGRVGASASSPHPCTATLAQRGGAAGTPVALPCCGEWLLLGSPLTGSPACVFSFARWSGAGCWSLATGPHTPSCPCAACLPR